MLIYKKVSGNFCFICVENVRVSLLFRTICAYFLILRILSVSWK